MVLGEWWKNHRSPQIYAIKSISFHPLFLGGLKAGLQDSKHPIPSQQNTVIASEAALVLVFVQQ
jgi:hypothetical protein